MKNEKVCVSKTLTYLVLLVLAVVGFFYMTRLTNTAKTVTNPKAAGDCKAVFAKATTDPKNGRVIYSRPDVSNNSCETKTFNGADINTGRKCSSGTFVKDVVTCPVNCIYGDKLAPIQSDQVVYLPTPEVDQKKVQPNTYRYQGIIDAPDEGCIYYVRNTKSPKSYTGYKCEFADDKVVSNGDGSYKARLTKDYVSCKAESYVACYYNTNPVYYKDNTTKSAGDYFIDIAKGAIPDANVVYQINKSLDVSYTSSNYEAAKCIPVKQADGTYFWYSSNLVLDTNVDACKSAGDNGAVCSMNTAYDTCIGGYKCKCKETASYTGEVLPRYPILIQDASCTTP